MKYVRIIRQELNYIVANKNKDGMTKHWKHSGSYVQPLNQLGSAMEAEFDDFESCADVRYVLEPENITDEQYKKLPEFTGW